jgi:hypothetical protein
MQSIEIYFACLENPNAIDYYSEVIKGMNVLVWDAMNAKRNTEIANWQRCSPLIGWHGGILMLPGS